MFIAVEGIDGAGTTSFCNNFCELLRKKGQENSFYHQPSRNNVLGQLIRDFLKDERVSEKHEMFALLFAAERIYQEAFWDEEKAEGKWVICDRHYWSSIAYQGALTKNLDWVVQLNRFALIPDLWIFIDTPIEETERRRSQRNEEADLYEKRSYQEKIREVYLELIQKSSAKKIVLDGMMAPLDLAKEGLYKSFKELGLDS